MKTCSHCQIEKSFDAFYASKHMRDGHSSWCKQCSRESTNAHREALRKNQARECWRCRKTKPSDEFYGVDALCKPCRSAYSHERYVADPGYFLSRGKQWAKDNPEKNSATKKAWRKANPEKVLAYERKWKEANRDLMRQRERERYDPEKAKIKNARLRREKPEMVRASKKRWNQANPDKVRAHVDTRRARRKGADVHDLTAAQWTFLKELYNHCCAYCGKPLEKRISKDHIVSLVNHGDHTLTNILPACQSCNSKKGDQKFIVPYLLRCADGIERPVDPFTP